MARLREAQRQRFSVQNPVDHREISVVFQLKAPV